MKFASLFQPLKINSLMIANRIISAPMNEALNDKRVRCGAGILIAGCGGVNLPNAWFDSEYLFSKAQIQKTRQWLNFMRQGGISGVAGGHAYGRRWTRSASRRCAVGIDRWN